MGDSGSTRLLAFGIVPLWEHHIRVVSIDEERWVMSSEEHGGPVRSWQHDLRVTPIDDERCRYEDVLTSDAGRMTAVTCVVARAFYRYRHRRWRLLVAAQPAALRPTLGPPSP